MKDTTRECYCGTDYEVLCAYCGEPLATGDHAACLAANGPLEEWDQGMCPQHYEAMRRAEAELYQG